jgi:hypothetical protein
VEVIDDEVASLREDELRNLVLVRLRSFLELAFLVAHGQRLAVVPVTAVLHPFVLEDQAVSISFELESVGILVECKVERKRGSHTPAVVQQAIRLRCDVDLKVVREHPLQQPEYTDEVGLAGAVGADDDVEVAEHQLRPLDRLEAFDLDLAQSFHRATSGDAQVEQACGLAARAQQDRSLRDLQVSRDLLDDEDFTGTDAG